MANAEPGAINALEDFTIETTNTFSRLRNSIKVNQDMFLFGKPTENILTIMMKLYHENTIRNLCYQDKPQLTKGSRRTTSSPGFTNAEGNSGSLSSIPLPSAFMCGIIEIDGQLYITISESPQLGDGPIEDPEFDKKEATLFALLDHTNINLVLPEGLSRNGALKNKIRWRNYNDKKPSPSILKPNGTTICKNIMFLNDSGNNYDDSLWEHKFTVNFINSYDYLNNRLDGFAFPPFKKYKEKTQFIECVNGSTCCEAKLFSFVYNDLKKTFNDIAGFGVFWVGNKLPPRHIFDNYCYQLDDPKLTNITNECISILPPKINEYFLGRYREDFWNYIMKLIVEQLALPCPGCFANYNNYTTGTYKMWNPKNCYRYLDARTLRSIKAQQELQRNGSPVFSFLRNGSPSPRLPVFNEAPARFSNNDNSRKRKNGGRRKTRRHN